MSAVYAFVVAGLRLLGHGLEGRAQGAAQLGQHVGDAPLHHHQRRPVLLHHDQREHPQALADWMLANGLGVITFLLAVNIILLLAGNFMEPSSIVLIFAPSSFPLP